MKMQQEIGDIIRIMKIFTLLMNYKIFLPKEPSLKKIENLLMKVTMNIFAHFKILMIPKNYK